MANRTDKEAYAIHGTNPQNLVEKIVRQKIYATTYWKEQCFALTAETVIEKAVDLKCVGGTFGGTRKPTPFLCLILKMLQIQPDKEIIIEYIKNEDFKYVRLLGAFYMRLVGRPLEVYQYLEPLYNDYRKIRLQLADGHYTLTHVDQAIDDMLHKDYLFDIALPRIPSRMVLEKTGQLDPRISVLDEEFDEAVLEAEAGQAAEQAEQAKEALKGEERGGRDRSPEKREKWRVRSKSPAGRRDRDREQDRDRDHDRDRRDHDYDRSERRRSRSRDRGGRRDDRDADRERDRRDRDRDRERERRRSRSRSRERRGDRDRDYDRGDRGDRDRDYDRGDRGDRDRDYDRGDRDRGRDKDRGGRERERGRERDGKDGREEKGKPRVADAEDPEIAEANALRAKLGLKPLR